MIPVIVSSQQAVGPNRFVFSFIDPKTNLPAASPDRSASVAFIAPGETDPGPAVPATFVWAIEGSRGDYVANTTFPAAGDWKAVFVTQPKDGPPEAIGVGFDVLDKATTVGVGQPAPATTNPVSADVGGDLAKISSDPKPDPAFYQTTVADALAAHKPFVLVFATPAFCTSAQCGPTLDRVKAAAAAAPKDVEFINVEPYQLTYAERQAPARPRREQPAPDGRRLEQVGPRVRAVDLHGRLGRDRQGLVRGRGRRRRAQGRDRRDRG